MFNNEIGIMEYLFRLISTRLKETNHWLWTWGIWEKVKYGLMGKA